MLRLLFLRQAEICRVRVAQSLVSLAPSRAEPRCVRLLRDRARTPSKSAERLQQHGSTAGRLWRTRCARITDVSAASDCPCVTYHCSWSLTWCVFRALADPTECLAVQLIRNSPRNQRRTKGSHLCIWVHKTSTTSPRTLVLRSTWMSQKHPINRSTNSPRVFLNFLTVSDLKPWDKNLQ